MNNTQDRRQFLGITAGCGACALARAGTPLMQENPASDSATPENSYEVIVFGGGAAGISAAAQAARAGAATLLVEKCGMLGGTTTMAGVNFPGLFHAWGDQVIAGIGWNLVRECVRVSGASLPDFDKVPEKHWQHQVRVNRALYAALADRVVEASGADILFYAMPAAVRREADRHHVTLCTKSGLHELSAKVLVDCTGDANVLTLAGCGMRRHDKRQPGTLNLRLSGYEWSRADEATLEEQCGKALEAGELLAADLPAGYASLRRLLVQQGGGALDVLDADGQTSAGRTSTELRARHKMLRIYRFLRRQPGFEDVTVSHMAPECGIRETVTIRGRATITAEDYLSGRLWPDAVCYSFYPIDWHRADGRGIEKKYLDEGTVATVPAGALQPEAHPNLLAAGRCISSDQLANSALRVQATCMATGQAAGAMAALAARHDAAAHELPVAAVHAVLREHGAIVPSAPA